MLYLVNNLLWTAVAGLWDLLSIGRSLLDLKLRKVITRYPASGNWDALKA